MERSQLRVFLGKAESQLAGIRSGLLLAAQNGFSVTDIQTAARRLDAIESDAASAGLTISGFSDRLRGISDANRALDVVASVEAELLQFSLRSNDFLADVDELVEESFDTLTAPAPVISSDGPVADGADFEIDEEMVEIFQEEAESLLASITANVQLLRSSPGDTNALWEIRRNAHTFKGAAGIVGFKNAASLAHRMEDLLDKMVKLRVPADPRITELLANAANGLASIISSKSLDDPKIEGLAASLDTALDLCSNGAKNGSSSMSSGRNEAKPTGQPTSIVRVSLERLDELIALARRLECEDRGHVASEIAQKLVRLRMVRFGTLETRLGRAVHVTCQEENKRADLVLYGAGAEIDTQVIDALIEPLLHLLKNAVVHGIEHAETRRLLGKPEKGRITVSVAANEAAVTITIKDDGSGISTEKLIRKAVANDIMTADAARTLSETEAAELIFHRGLTTAESLNMNAGRGVGMSIVRQCVEGHGGTLALQTEPQKGAAFTITFPVATSLESKINSEPPGPVDGVPLVLVVDDSASIRQQMAKWVADAGLTAITASDGAEALELLLNGLEPGLILSDVEMPNMNGWEFLEYVKTDKNFGHVPVVVITSLDDTKYRQMASRLGASDYIVKPFASKDLETVFAKFCSVMA